MSEEIIEEQPVDDAASEPSAEPQVEQQVEQKMVPLAALEAERRKRQELESRQAIYENMLRANQAGETPKEEEDPNALVEKRTLQLSNAATKRDILETLYQDTKPEAVQMINKYLGAILEKKPWLAATVDTAQNRYARAYEIVNDYLHLVEEKPVVKQSVANNDGRRIVQNAQKPRSPVEIGKSAQPGGTEYLKSIAGKKEFREYREKVLRGEA